MADFVTGIVELTDQEVTAVETILPRLEYLEGVARLPDGMIMIHDLDKFLSLDEEEVLGAALENFQVTKVKK